MIPRQYHTLGLRAICLTLMAVSAGIAALADNVFTVQVKTPTTTNLANIIYASQNYVNGSTIAFDTSVDAATLQAAISGNAKTMEINGVEYTGIINADANGKVMAVTDAILVKGENGRGVKGDYPLKATYIKNHFVNMTVEGQVLKVEYIGDQSEVQITYDIYYDGDFQFTRYATGKIGNPYPRIDNDFDRATGQHSILPYGIRATNYPGTNVVETTRHSLETEYLYTAIPFYPEGTRYSSIKQWYACTIGRATVDSTPVPDPDRTTDEYKAKHDGVYYFYNHNGELRLSDRMVLTETEYTTLDDLEPGYGWAMIGSPYAFRIMNKLAGQGKYLRFTPVGNDGDGFFTFDTEGTVFGVTYNYSVLPGDYAWAGYQEAMNLPALGLNGYPPYSYGCSIVLPEEMDASSNTVPTLTLTDDGQGGKVVRMTSKSMMHTEGMALEELVTMNPACHVYMGTMGSSEVSMDYEVKVEIPCGLKIHGGVRYGDDTYLDGTHIFFAAAPHQTDFVAEAIEDYEGIVSIDHQDRRIVVTYLRTTVSADYKYIRHTGDWQGYFISNDASRSFTCNPYSASLVYPIIGGRASGALGGRVYHNARTFYILEQHNGSYWTTEGMEMSMENAERFVFVDREGNVAENPTDGTPYAIVPETALQQASDVSLTWNPAPYASVACALTAGNLSYDWELISYKTPHEVTLSVWQSSDTGVLTPFNTGTVYWGLGTVQHNGKLYSIDEDGNRIPGLRIPVLNPTADAPSLYTYKLDVQGGSLSVIYQEVHKVKSESELQELVRQGTYFAIYNSNGMGFLSYNKEFTDVNARPRGAWEVRNSNLAMDKYSEPVSLLTGYMTWQLELDEAGKAYYLKNTGSGYYLNEDAQGNYHFSTTKAPISKYEDLSEKGYLQIEMNDNFHTWAGIDLADPVAPFKSIEAGAGTQFQIVAPPPSTTYYTIACNLEQGGLRLLTTDDIYLDGEKFFYTRQINEDNKGTVLQPVDVPGYQCELTITNNKVSTPEGVETYDHTGNIDVRYVPDINGARQFYVRGTIGGQHHNYFWGNGGNVQPANSTGETRAYYFEPTGAQSDGKPTYHVYYATTEKNSSSEDVEIRHYMTLPSTSEGSSVAFVRDRASADSEASIPASVVAVVLKDAAQGGYYIMPANSSGMALSWQLPLTVGTTPLALHPATSQDQAFLLLPVNHVTYDIVITGDDGGKGRIRAGAHELKHGDTFSVDVSLSTSDFNVKPLDGTHYALKMEGNTITVTYSRYGLAGNTSEIQQDGTLYTVRSTAYSPETGHDGEKGYYKYDDSFAGDWDDPAETAIDYTDTHLLWQVILYNGNYYVWNEHLNRPVGIAMPAETMDDMLAQGKWLLEKTPMKGVPPLYKVTFTGYPLKADGMAGDPSLTGDALRILMPRTDRQYDEASPLDESDPEGSGYLYTEDTYLYPDRDGRAEGIFPVLPIYIKQPRLQYKEGETWKDLDQAAAQGRIGATYQITIVGYNIEVRFTETAEHIKQRAETLLANGRGKYLYPVEEEYETLQKAYDAASSNDPKALTALSDAILRFIRKDVPVKYPEPGSLLHITNRKTGYSLYYNEGYPVSRLTNMTASHPNSVWRFEMGDTNADGGRNMSLYNANGDKTLMTVYTPYQAGHPEWRGSLLGVHNATGGAFFDPEYDILAFDREGNPTAGTFAADVDGRFSLLSNLLEGTPLEQLALQEGIRATYSSEEVRDVEAAYWSPVDYVLPKGCGSYAVKVKGAPSDAGVVKVTTTLTSDHTVKSATEGGYFILSDDEAEASNFSATDLGYGSRVTIEIDKDAKTITAVYTLNDYYKEKLTQEVAYAKAMVDDDPETYGYPSQDARSALRTVINLINGVIEAHKDDSPTYFDATTYAQLNRELMAGVEAYSTTDDVILPSEGDIIQINGLLDMDGTNPRRGWLVKNGASLDIKDASDDSASGLWILRGTDKERNYYLESAYGDGRYLTNAGISTMPTPWFFTRGTQKGRVSMFFVGNKASRYVETVYENGEYDFGSMSGDHAHATTQRKQAYDPLSGNGESTDFEFTPSDRKVIKILVEGYPEAMVTSKQAVYDGNQFMKGGGFVALPNQYVEALDGNPSFISTYISTEMVPGMDSDISYDPSTHTVTVTYIESLASLKERMTAVLNNARNNDLYGGHDIDVDLTTVEAATDRATIENAMHAFYQVAEGRNITLQNKATSSYLFTAGGVTLYAKANSGDEDGSIYQLIHVSHDASYVEPLYYIYNVACGNFVAAITATRIVSTPEEGEAGQFEMTGYGVGGAGYITLTCRNGSDKVGDMLANLGASSDISASTPSATPTDNQLWTVGEKTAMATIPVNGKYYYKRAPYIADKPEDIYYVTRSEGDFVLQCLGTGETTTMTLTQAKAETWTELSIPFQEYEDLLWLYHRVALHRVGTGVGRYTDNGNIVTAKANAVAALQGRTDSQCRAQFSALSEALDQLQLNMPTTGFYRLRNVRTGKYLSMNKAVSDIVCPVESITDAGKELDAASIFYFQDCAYSGTDNTATPRMLNFCNGQYLYACNVVCYPEYQNDAKNFKVQAHASDIGAYSFYYKDTDEYLACGTRYSAVSKTMADDPTTSWYLEEVGKLPVTVSSVGYATLYLPAEVTIPADVTVSKVDKLTADSNPATPESGEASVSILSGSIPAGTPVILQATAGTYLFEITSYPAGLPTDDTPLRGVLATTTQNEVEKDNADNDIFVLMKGTVDGSKQVGFFRDYIGNLSGFKAFLLVPENTSSNVKAFLIASAPDGMDGVDGRDEGNGEIYSLDGVAMGRDLEKLPRGIYVIDGKRVLNTHVE